MPFCAVFFYTKLLVNREKNKGTEYEDRLDKKVIREMKEAHAGKNRFE